MSIQQPATHPIDSQTRKRLLEAVSVRLDALDAGQVTAGRVDELAERMVAVIPQPSPWNDVLGPFYSTQAVQRFLGVTRQAVQKRVRSGSLVRVVTQDGTSLFPAFQFRDARPVQGLLEVVAELRRGTTDEYAIAQWLAIRDPASGTSPLDRMVAGQIAAVLSEAAHTAAAWAA
ncbi:hypothetical protein [Glaciibacter superstes]|uniref:hypothetical protein n=1 Tax=Glaciibacter superstes TaxID=501023 RepID=UPI0003B585DB|nr:hypothetical protein [Glaciibacter superstes]